jgi:hypothetical protein
VRKLLTSLCLWITAAASAAAQVPLVGAGTGAGAFGSSYVGPGDLVASASGWWGLRAYSKAYAASGGKAINILRSGDNSTTDIDVLANGSLDVVTAQNFSTVVATGTGLILGTTLTFTGSLTTHQLVTGTGVSPGTVITGGSSPTRTVSISQTVVSETLTIRQGLYVQTLYDQSGNGNNLTNSGSTFQGGLLLFNNGPSGSLPSVQNNAGYGGLGAVLTQPYVFSWVAVRTANFTTQQATLATYHGSNAPSDVFFTTANTFALSVTADATVTAADGTWHAEQSIYNGSSSIAYHDGTQTTGLNPGTSTSTSGHVYMGNVNGGSNQLVGDFVEGGIWSGAFTTPQQQGVNSNQHAFWGF